MEAAFQTSFQDVRISEGADVSTLGAEAYARGSELRFAPGRFDPHTPGGQALIGHELVHVMQQRAGRVRAGQGKGAAINSEPALEAEADRLGAKAASGEGVALPGAGATASAGAAMAPIQRKKTAGDVDTIEEGDGGSVNRVDKVKYHNNILDSGTNRGFFKPEPVYNPERPDAAIIPTLAEDIGIQKADARMSGRAVASSKLDAWLGTNVLAREDFAEHPKRGGGLESGSVSADVGGKKLVEGVWGPLPAAHAAMGNDLVEGNPGKYRKKGGGFEQLQHQQLNRIDYGNAKTQKGLLDLQLVDFISGQADRHGGNIHVLGDGSVKGIDNDIAFGDPAKASKREIEGDKRAGMPNLIDAATAERVMKLKSKDLSKVLNAGAERDQKLNKAELKAAKGRMKELKGHIKHLQKGNGLVGEGDYGAGLLARAHADGGDSYLKRHDHMFNHPAGNEQQEPLPAPPSTSTVAPHTFQPAALTTGAPRLHGGLLANRGPAAPPAPSLSTSPSSSPSTSPSSPLGTALAAAPLSLPSTPPDPSTDSGVGRRNRALAQLRKQNAAPLLQNSEET
jgi:hypothetical protein